MVAGAVMILVTVLLRASLPPEMPELARFAVLVAGGAAVYVGILWLAFRKLALELLHLMRPSPARSV
jgi:hypothetical protein